MQMLILFCLSESNLQSNEDVSNHMRTSFRNLENRISKLEMLIQPPEPCNCRAETRYHNSHCLLIILRKTARECPVHGFREMGFFFWTARQYPLLEEDDEVCPCPSHPWRSFLLGPKPLTWEGNYAATRAWEQMPEETYHVEDERLLTEAIMDAYTLEQQHWSQKTGRRMPSHKEIVKQVWNRAGKRPRR